MTNGIAAPLRRRLAVFALVIGAAVLLPGAGHAAGCADASEQEFLPWLDVAYYRLAPGGGFEGKNRAWKFTGGAEKQVVNEKFFLRSESDKKSLHLPANSSATTPFFCVAPLDPTVRFVARNRGGLLSVLKVDVLLKTVAGDVKLPGGVVAGGKSWAPSPIVPLFANLLAPLSGDTATVAVRFSTGGTSAWQIDDVYVDPFRSR
jgi:hypothetical protein